MSNAYLLKAPSGVPGDITRPDETNVEPAKFASADIPAVFGFPVIFTAGVPKKWAGSSVATDFQGVLVREVPGIAASSASDTVNNAAPWYQQVQGICVRGYMNVKCAAGTPVRGGVVYVQITASGGVAVGEFRADGTDTGNAVALTATQAEWASDGVDTDLNAEIRIAR